MLSLRISTDACHHPTALKLSTLIPFLHHKLPEGNRGVAGFSQCLELTRPPAPLATPPVGQLWQGRTSPPDSLPISGRVAGSRARSSACLPLTKEGPGGTSLQPPGPEATGMCLFPGRRPRPCAPAPLGTVRWRRGDVFTPDHSPAAESSLPGVVSGPPVGKAV